MTDKTKILVIEDSEEVAQLLRLQLERIGAKVAVAGSGRDGVVVARKQRPDVVLLDLALPDATGFDVLKDIKLAGPVPVIALSGYPEEGARERCLAAGFDAFLQKTLDSRRLLATIDHCLAARSMGNAEVFSDCR